MKILLDEGVPDLIKHQLSSFSIFSVKEMAWRGVKNGALLDLMTDRFQIIVTTDKNLPHQQNLKKRKISAIILPANDIPTVIALLSQIARAIGTILPGEFNELDLPKEDSP